VREKIFRCAAIASSSSLTTLHLSICITQFSVYIHYSNFFLLHADNDYGMMMMLPNYIIFYHLTPHQNASHRKLNEWKEIESEDLIKMQIDCKIMQRAGFITSRLPTFISCYT
jgi:hypothetical protein